MERNLRHTCCSFTSTITKLMQTATEAQKKEMQWAGETLHKNAAWPTDGVNSGIRVPVAQIGIKSPFASVKQFSLLLGPLSYGSYTYIKKAFRLCSTFYVVLSSGCMLSRCHNSIWMNLIIFLLCDTALSHVTCVLKPENVCCTVLARSMLTPSICLIFGILIAVMAVASSRAALKYCI